MKPLRNIIKSNLLYCRVYAINDIIEAEIGHNNFVDIMMNTKYSYAWLTNNNNIFNKNNELLLEDIIRIIKLKGVMND
jgi:hypothetical protein